MLFAIQRWINSHGQYIYLRGFNKIGIGNKLSLKTEKIGNKFQIGEGHSCTNQIQIG